MNPKIERRFFKNIELRAADNGGQVIDGYAAVFNSLSVELWGFREMIMPGAFADALRDPAIDVKALFNHDDNWVIGRYYPQDGITTCTLSEDERGLHTVIEPSDDMHGQTVVKKLQRGDVDAMSFAFEAVSEEWQWDTADGVPLRRLLQCRLFDVSVVTYPAYPATSVGVRKVYGAIPDVNSEEFRSRYAPHSAPPVVPPDLRLKQRALTLKIRGLT